jgi:hypothetical protein
MKNLIVALLAASLVGCAGPKYEANFIGIELGCCIVRDTLHTNPPQAMQEGRSNLPGETAHLNTADGALQMVTMPPVGVASGVASTIGIYSTQLSLGQGTSFVASARFQSPTRELSYDPWSLLLIMRPGDAADDPTVPRLQLSLRTVQIGAPELQARSVELRVQEGPNAADAGKLPGASAEITGAAYDEIYNLHKPFTLVLIVDRTNGTGSAFLTTKTQAIAIGTFKTGIFTQNTGTPIITTIGATLANSAPGLLASVELTHFEIQTK